MHTLSQTNTSFRGSRSIGTASRSSTECKDAARSTCHISFCEWSHEISRDVAGEVWEFGPMFPVAHCWIPLCLDHPLSILYQYVNNSAKKTALQICIANCANRARQTQPVWLGDASPRHLWIQMAITVGRQGLDKQFNQMAKGFRENLQKWPGARCLNVKVLPATVYSSQVLVCPKNIQKCP